MKCFFCDTQTISDDKIFLENNLFFARYDDFAVSPGHIEIIPKRHIESFFALTSLELQELYALILQAKQILSTKFSPDGYNVGLNEGLVAGQTINHLHIHIIPRYKGDVQNPRGGIRNIIHGKGDYTAEDSAN